MGLRNAIKTAVLQPSSLFFEGPIREVVEEVLAHRGFVMPGDHRALQDQVSALEKTVTALQGHEQEITKLKKKLNMAMGAIQAATAQLSVAKTASEQANQRAISSQATAEAAMDGLTGLEDAFAALVEKLGSNAGQRNPVLPNFTLLDGSIADLKKGLEQGSQDVHLPALLAAEEAGRARVGAIRAIQQRM